MPKYNLNLTCIALLFAGGLVLPGSGTAGENVMSGFPPSPESQVTLKNRANPPYNRWAFRNMGIGPSVMVARGKSVFQIPRALKSDHENMAFTFNGKSYTLLSAIKQENTDGYIVIKNGKIVYERYFGKFRAHDHHLWASSTKSLVGMAAGILVQQGMLDLSKKASDYIPELKGSAFAALTVQSILNMVSALDFSEDYANIKQGSVSFEYFRRVGLLPDFELMQIKPEGAKNPRGVLHYLSRFKQNKKLKPNTVYEYHSPNVDVIGWIIARQSGMPLQDFIREHIWSKLQTEHDAFFMTDAEFTAVATGGYNTTLRDFARLGLAVVNDGTLGGVRIFPKSWVKNISKVTDEQMEHTTRSIYKDKKNKAYDDKLIAYKNFWWIHDRDRGIFTARGVYGQTLYVDQSRNVVIAFFSSAPTASNARRNSYKALLHGTKVLSEKL